jgi:tetratricopeptide (TPR) repeat protein
VLKWMPIFRACVFLMLLPACQNGTESSSSPDNQRHLEGEYYAVSFLGQYLAYPTFDEKTENRLNAQLAEARHAATANPDSEDALIWHGRRLAYLGRYHEAIRVYTDGLRSFPQSERILRHRGHRYISSRQLDAAIVDFEKSANIAQNKANRIEEDGMPNAMNKPIGTTKGNIWYHLGLAKYLRGDFDGALRAYDLRMLQTDNNDDNRVSTAYWRYIILMRLGRQDEAQNALRLITPQMEVIENQSYWDLVLLFKGVKKADDFMAGGDAVHDQHVMNATLEYGLSMHDYLQGNLSAAESRWLAIIESKKATTAFGFIAAEAELARP